MAEKSGKRRSQKELADRVDTEMAFYFGAKLEYFLDNPQNLQNIKDFARIVNFHESYISLITAGKYFPYSNVRSSLLPGLIALGIIATATNARIWIEPVYGAMREHELSDLYPMILGVKDTKLPLNIIEKNADFFINSIKESYQVHPARYTLDEAYKIFPPTIREVIKFISELPHDDIFISYCNRLIELHDPEIESLIIKEVFRPENEHIKEKLRDIVTKFGTNEAINSLPRLWDIDAYKNKEAILILLPIDAIHRGKEAVLSLLSSEVIGWRELAAEAIARDPDQCEIIRILEIYFEREDKVLANSIDYILANIPQGLIDIPAIKYICQQIFNHRNDFVNHRPQGTHPDEWKFEFIMRGLKTIQTKYGIISDEICISIVESIIPYLAHQSFPPVSSLAIFEFPEFIGFVKEIRSILGEKYLSMMDIDEYNSYLVVVKWINVLLAIGDKKVKEYLLEMYKNTRSTLMKGWVLKTLVKKTDMKFNIIQYFRYKTYEIRNNAILFGVW
jgi:hypothetical protein